MSSPFVGQIMMFAGNFAPEGWALCQGQLLSVAENEQLFNLIGTTGGGQPHLNMMPSQALNFCIRLSGPFPGQ